MNNQLTYMIIRLYDEIEYGLNEVFDEAFTEIINKLACTRFVTKKSVEKAFTSAEKTLKSNLEKRSLMWLSYIADELIRNHIVVENSPLIEDISEILNAERMYYICADALMSEADREAIRVELLKYSANLIIIPPSKLESAFEAVPVYVISQTRINHIKSRLDDYKSCLLIVIRRRMDNLFKKIQTICNEQK